MRTRPVRRVMCAAVACAGASCAAPASAPPGPAPGPAAAAPVTYAPGTIPYRRASYLYVEQDVGGQTQRLNEVLVYFVSATLARQGDRLMASLTVDSVPRYESDGPATGVADRARGARFTGALAPTGEITSLGGGDSSNKLVQQLAEEFPNFYPRIPSTGVEPESHWTDTTTTTSKSGGLPLSVIAVSQHEAGAPADVGTDRVLPIRTLTTYSFSGAGQQGGQAYSVEGDGRRHTTKHLSLSGRFLGMVAADTSSYIISLRGLDIAIPGRQTRADTLSVVP